MIPIELSEDYEKKLEQIAKSRRLPKEEFVKTLLRQYVDDYYQKATPFELGKELFGKFGSGKGERSRTYKKLLKEKLRGKYTY